MNGNNMMDEVSRLQKSAIKGEVHAAPAIYDSSFSALNHYIYVSRQ